MKRKTSSHRPKLGARAGLISQRNRVHKDKKKDKSKRQCRGRVKDE